MPRLLAALCLCFVTISLSSAAASDAPSFQWLPDGPGGQRPDNHAYSLGGGVSPDGSVPVGVGWPLGTTPGPQAYRWQGDVPTPMGDLAGGAYNSLAWAASTHGDVIVGVGTSDSGSEAFRSVGGSMTGLGDLPGGTFSSEALDVSNNGSVIVGSGMSASGREAFRWENGVIVGLGDLSGGSFGSVARGVSANGGVIVGEAQSASGTEAFRWENGVMTGLGDLPGGLFQSSANDVSADGSVIVGASQRLYPFGGRDEAFRWKDGVMTGLGTLNNGNSYARAVSGDGSVIVGSVGTGINGTAFIWDEEHGMRDLKTLVMAQLGSQLGIDFINFSKLLEATGISDDGSTIVGLGENSYGRGEAWIFVIPEPSTDVLVLCGLTALAAARRQRKPTRP